MSRRGSDRWVWLLDEDGVFSVKGLRNLVEGRLFGSSNYLDSTKWISILPKIVNIFVWKLKIGRFFMREVWISTLGYALVARENRNLSNTVSLVAHLVLKSGKRCSNGGAGM